MAIKFDLSSITEPVDSATLKLQVKKLLSNGTGICTLSTITTDWVSTECSWLNAKAGTPWNTMGGDYSSEGRVTGLAGNAGEVETYDVTAMVNAFITGQKPNYGFLIEPATSSDLVIQMQDHFYHSSEYSEVPLRPALVLKTGPDEIINNNIFNGITGVKVIKGNNGITVTSMKGSISATLFDLKGRELTSKFSKQGNCFFDIQNLGKGVLFLRIAHQSGVESFPVFIH